MKGQGQAVRAAHTPHLLRPEPPRQRQQLAAQRRHLPLPLLPRPRQLRRQRGVGAAHALDLLPRLGRLLPCALALEGARAARHEEIAGVVAGGGAAAVAASPQRVCRGGRRVVLAGRGRGSQAAAAAPASPSTAAPRLGGGGGLLRLEPLGLCTMTTVVSSPSMGSGRDTRSTPPSPQSEDILDMC